MQKQLMDLQPMGLQPIKELISLDEQGLEPRTEEIFDNFEPAFDAPDFSSQTTFIPPKPVVQNNEFAAIGQEPVLLKNFLLKVIDELMGRFCCNS